MNSTNIERTGDRDIRWSEIMRLPSSDAFPACHYLRSFDLDAFMLCERCALPLFLVEATRDISYQFNVANKPHRYTQKIAKKLGVPSLVCWHGIENGVEIIRSHNGRETKTYTINEWKTKLERLFRDHAMECKG